MRNVPLLLGHRGARGFRSVPENTLASFDLALEHGCDGFEFDVRLTACGRAVVCHNPRVGNIVVADAHARQLLDLPVLEDVLARYGDRVFLDIELKVEGLESKLLSAIRDHPPRGFVVSSFLPSVILDLRARSGRVPLGIICDQASQLACWPQSPAEYVIVELGLANHDLIARVQAAGKKLLVWTVNERRDMQRLASAGCDGIISDETQLLVKTLRTDGTPGNRPKT